MGYFKVDFTKLRFKIRVARTAIKPEMFKDELDEYARKSLATAARNTPVRSLALISRNQKREYVKRINYIPSWHWPNADPRLVVKTGKHFMYFRGKWYRPDIRKVPSDQWNAYQTLLAERNRRMATAQSDFVTGRAQARFLWARSWYFIGLTIGLAVRVKQAIYLSHTRRKPEQDPPPGHAQYISKKDSLEIKIYNPFLASDSRYNESDPKQIMGDSIAGHKKQYLRTLQRKLVSILKGIFE